MSVNLCNAAEGSNANVTGNAVSGNNSVGGNGLFNGEDGQINGDGGTQNDNGEFVGRNGNAIDSGGSTNVSAVGNDGNAVTNGGGEGGQVARGADRALSGDDRQQVRVEQLEQSLHDHRSDPTVALCEGSGPEEQHRPHEGRRQGDTDAGGVAAQ